MSIFNYKEQKPWRGILFLTPYLIIWIVIGTIYFGGFHKFLRQLLSWEDNMYYSIGIAIAIVVLYLLILFKLNCPSTLNIGANSILIKQRSKPDVNIPFSSISTVKVNTPDLNSLAIIDNMNKTLFTVYLNRSIRQLLYDMADEIATHIEFNKETREKAIQQERFNTIIYKRK